MIDEVTLASKLENHERRIVGLEHRVKIQEENQKSNYDLTISVKELAISVKNMTEEQKEQGERITELEKKPARRWESVSTVVVTGIVSAIVGALITAVISLL